MICNGTFDKVLVINNNGYYPWVLFQINVSRPHLNGVTDTILCAKKGYDAFDLLGLKQGEWVSVEGNSYKIRITDIDFTQKDTIVFVCRSVDYDSPLTLKDVPAELSEMLIKYYNKTE